MTIENPTRLKTGELGAVLRAADPAVTTERLAANAARIKLQLATASTFALWKLLVMLGVLALAVPVVVKLASRAPEPAPAAARPIVTAQLAPLVADAGVAPIEPAPPPEPAPAPPPPPEVAPAPRHHASVVHTVDAGVAPAPDAAPEPSQLPAQIALYEAARAAAARGELANALDLLDQLLREYPTTQLRSDAELTRAELLARGDRAEAVAALEALSTEPAHAGRRAELLRTLGDLLRRRGDCTRALDAYRRALEAKPSDKDRKAAEAGRDHCQRAH